MGEVGPAYRAVLKAIRRHVERTPESRSLREHAASIFRRRAVQSEALPQAELAKSVTLAQDYAFLVNSVHSHRELLMSYNIAVDRTAEQAQRLRSTADRVGLQLPVIVDHPDPNQ